MLLFFKELLKSGEDIRLLIFSLIIDLVLSVAFHFLMGFAIFTMSKKTNTDKEFLAFIPIANIVQLARLAGKITIFQKPIKNIWIWVLVFYALDQIFVYISYLETYLYILNYNRAAIPMQEFFDFLRKIDLVILLINIVSIFFIAHVYYKVYMMFIPHRAFMYTIVSIFFAPVFLFAASRHNLISFKPVNIPPQGQNPQQPQDPFGGSSNDNDPFGGLGK